MQKTSKKYTLTSSVRHTWLNSTLVNHCGFFSVQCLCLCVLAEQQCYLTVVLLGQLRSYQQNLSQWSLCLLIESIICVKKLHFQKACQVNCVVILANPMQHKLSLSVQRTLASLGSLQNFVLFSIENPIFSSVYIVERQTQSLLE